jgi:hypothetical protein
MRERRNACRLLVGMAEGKKQVERSRYSCVDNIKMDVREMG